MNCFNGCYAGLKGEYGERTDRVFWTCKINGIRGLVYHEVVVVRSNQVKQIAFECGFELAGIARALPHQDFSRYSDWLFQGYAGQMAYLTDYRAERRSDPRSLLPTAKSVICLAKYYNSDQPLSCSMDDPARGWISRYAWSHDYHDVLRAKLSDFVARLQHTSGVFDYKLCVDTAPLLERSYARQAGLGWIGKNTCLINQQKGSWCFLAEVLVSLELDPDSPPPDRCGTCTRCIDACPTSAIGAEGLDATRCISYFTIELRGSVPEAMRNGIGTHLFGCDICQDVCPWNRRADVSEEFAPIVFAPDLEEMAALTQDEFRARFRATPVYRAKWRGFLRNVAVAMGNSADPKFLGALEKLANCGDTLIEEHARWALGRLKSPEKQL